MLKDITKSLSEMGDVRQEAENTAKHMDKLLELAETTNYFAYVEMALIIHEWYYLKTYLPYDSYKEIIVKAKKSFEERIGEFGYKIEEGKYIVKTADSV